MYLDKGKRLSTDPTTGILKVPHSLSVIVGSVGINLEDIGDRHQIFVRRNKTPLFRVGPASEAYMSVTKCAYNSY
jgi:hypothetical protein